MPSGSFIDTIHESCLGQVDESIDRSYTNNNDDVEHDDGYNHEELVDAAIEDLSDDPSHTNEVFKHALNELSQQDPSTMHSNLGNYQSQQSAHVSHPMLRENERTMRIWPFQTSMPFADDILSASFMSTVSFADQLPNLLHSKEVQSEYSYFDITKLKLFAGPNIWKYKNLLNPSAATSAGSASTIQHQQAPAVRQRIPDSGHNGGSVGPKRHVRVDVAQSICIAQIMSGNREKKAVGISQSALILRMREKNLNQMQLARKIRPLTDLTNSHNFPELNFENLHSNNRPLNHAQEAAHEHDDFEDHDFHEDNPHQDNEGNPDVFRGVFQISL